MAQHSNGHSQFCARYDVNLFGPAYKWLKVASGSGGRTGAAATPMRTPLRDELGLNDPGATPAAILSRREERAREAAARAELREGLLGLPAPQNEYQASQRSTSWHMLAL